MKSICETFDEFSGYFDNLSENFLKHKMFSFVIFLGIKMSVKLGEMSKNLNSTLQNDISFFPSNFLQIFKKLKNPKHRRNDQ